MATNSEQVQTFDASGTLVSTTTRTWITTTDQDNAQTLQAKAQQALASNATFQAIASPTNAQNAAQVQALTKQCNGIIRLLLGLLDSTTGT